MKLAPARKADRILIGFLLLADAVTIPLSFLITWFLRIEILRGHLPGFHHNIQMYLRVLPVVFVIWLYVFARNGLYSPKRHLGNMGELQKLIRAFVTILVTMMAISYLVKTEYSRIILFLFTGISIPLSALTRSAARKLAQLVAPVREVPKILVVGNGEVAGRVIRTLRRLPGVSPEICGVLATTETGEDSFHGVDIVASLDEIREKLSELEIDEVFFAAPELDHSRIMDIIASLGSRKIHYRLVTDLFEIAIGVTDFDDLAKLPIVEIGYGEPGPMHRTAKRIMDLCLSVFLIVLTAPLMLVIYIVQLVRKEGSAIFRQERVGLRGKRFTLYKFRTMKPESDEYEVAPISMDDDRITGMGRFLRRTSLDELPQLFNVLKGDMSMVGPRPEMPFIVEEYNSWQKHRLDVKPGLTGMWQIMGRKELPLHDNLEYDYYYIRNQSLMLDVTILLRTIAVIFKGRGAY